MAGPWNAGIPLLIPQGTYGLANPVVQYASFSLASSATSQTSTVIASSSGYHAVIIGGMISVSSNASITFQSHTTSAQATGTWSLTSAAAQNNIQLAYSPAGYFGSAVNEGMDVLMIGSQILGMLTFIYI